MKNLLRFGAILSVLLVVASLFFPHEASALAHAISPAHSTVVLHTLKGVAVGLSFGCVQVPLAAIEHDDCPNPGGLTDLHVIRRRDIDVFPAVDADGVTISTALVPKTGKKFVPWEFAQDTGEVTHKSSGDAGNQSIAHELSVYVPRGAAATDAVIQSALNGDFVVAGRDSNGNMRLCGDERRGVKFEHDYKSGKKGNDKNGTDFKFSGEGFTHVPFYYTAALPV
ncbi:MAG: hypothetical protein ACRYFX_08675 [Janthinobacterium lividum]